MVVSRQSGIASGKLSLLSLVGLFAFSFASFAQTPVHKIGMGVVTLNNAMEQRVVSKKGAEYRIFVSVPLSPPPVDGWPVIYVLDGNGFFPMLSQLARLQGSERPDKTGAVPAIVVGVGYPGAEDFNLDRRVEDFTPSAELREPNPAKWRRSGGADTFMAFLMDELKPLIAGQYPVDQKREALFGHSLGGLFALYARFRYPTGFDSFAAVSPSVWWNRDFILSEADRFIRLQSPIKNEASLLIAVGGNELPMMVSGARAMADRLRPIAEQGGRIAYQEITGDNHISCVPVAFNRLLDTFLKPTAADLDFYALAEAR